MIKIITPAGVLAYPVLFTPKLPHNAKPGAAREYSVEILFTEADMKTAEYAAMVEAVFEAAEEGFGKSARVMLEAGKLKSPFRSDIEKRGYPSEFVRFIGARTRENEQYPGPQVIGAGGRLLTAREVYSGVKGRLSLTAKAYNNESKGVTFYLGNVLKMADGERLVINGSSGATEASSDFAGMVPAEEPAGNVADLL